LMISEETPQYHFKYSFVPVGSAAKANAESPELQIRRNRVFLDVGNAIEMGALDHHQADYPSNARLLFSRPELVLNNIDEPSARESVTVEIVVHHQPDLDAIACAYLVRHLIGNRNWPAGVNELLAYVDAADSGRLSSLQPSVVNVANLAIAIAVLDEPAKDAGSLAGERELRIMKRGWELLDYVLQRIAGGNAGSFFDETIFCDDHPFKDEAKVLRMDYELYQEDLKGYTSQSQSLCECFTLSLPLYNEQHAAAPALLWNEVPTCILHKHWARSDATAPGGQGYILTFIPAHLGYFDKSLLPEHPPLSRVIIAVTPDCGIALKELGPALERAEQKRQQELFGDNFNRWRSRHPDKIRPGYDIEDPWYDGRGHGYTIIDSPIRGSLLSINEIKQILLDLYHPVT